jgi:hypothetical protein
MTSLSHVFVFLSKLFIGRVWLLNIIVINAIYFYICFRFMASHRSVYFSGATDANGTHEKSQFVAGNATWFNEFTPGIECSDKRIADVLLLLFHSLALCCATGGEFAMYIDGKLVSRPDSITIYVAYHRQNFSSDISALLQLKRTLAFSFGCLDFSLVPECSMPGKIIQYVIRYGVEVRALKIVCIQCTQPCGRRCNMDFTCYIWSTFDYYCADYAVIVLPSQTSGDKIVYVRIYQAEIGGENSRLCGQCVCINRNPRACYNFCCIERQTCGCALYLKQPLI